nr:hypothetical protein [Mycoplasmopsis bovis]
MINLKNVNGYKDEDFGWKEFPPGFYDGIKTNDSGDNRNIEPKPAFKVNRIKENSLDLDFGVFEKNKYKYELDHNDRIDAFEDSLCTIFRCAILYPKIWKQ